MPPVTGDEYTLQCNHAAQSSRLNPWELHQDEAKHLLRSLTVSEIKTYLAARNAILRLWTHNPSVFISSIEALECAKTPFQRLASFAHEWLARNGYINHGCVEITPVRTPPPPKTARQRTVCIIGAGISGLCCARQIHAICAQFSERWTVGLREPLPRIVVLEARPRVGGRIYSLPLKTQSANADGIANTAEMGAQIITGFDRGNPLDILVRGQLALKHQNLRDNLVLYDVDGTIIDESKDRRIQDIFNEVLEAASIYGWKPFQRPAIDSQRYAAGTTKTSSFVGGLPSPAPSNTPPINGLIRHPLSLGTLMDDIVERGQQTTPMTALDLRLLNWHYANLEYANAVNVDELSLGGWDQDGGNEFEGPHSQVIGGYSQVPRALLRYPFPLDVRFNKVVHNIKYDSARATIQCEDGESFNAEHVVVSLPLGVLKECRPGLFEPPLPMAKSGAISRMGFGILNKLVLVFDRIFWDENRDMFGTLNAPTKNPYSLHQKDYKSNRGKFYLFWNCVKTSGRPMLIALMAGDSALWPEVHSHHLAFDACTRLQNIFRLKQYPEPVEVIVTNWRSDKFARGSYSYLGPEALPHDYEEMARPVGNMHFAGEATCGSHPATVHGAYLSGLRAASEVVETMIGPIPGPEPFQTTEGPASAKKRKKNDSVLY